jgi:PAS domain S-box-containing protein
MTPETAHNSPLRNAASGSASTPSVASLNELLGRLAEMTDDVILITDAEPIDEPGPRIVYVNPAFTRMTGYAPEEVIGLTPRVLQGPKTCQVTRARIRDALQQWQPIRCELLNYRKDGSEFWSELGITPVADESGIFRFWVSVQRDVSQAKQRERELVNTQRLKAVGEMTGGIAHDFNNLLTGISGAAELLAQRVTQDAESAKLVEAIRGAARSGSGQVRRLLSFSRTPLLNRGPVDLHELLEELVLMLRHSLRDNITLEVDLDPRARWVDAEAVQLESALLNLVINAQDAISGSGHVVLSTRHLEQDGRRMVHLEVSDSGCGMDEHSLSQVFEPFFTTKEAGRGSGLGLAMVQAFITQMGGHIEARSQPGQGSSFIMSLAAAQPVALPSGQIPLERSGAPHDAPVSRVLVVEDDDVVRLIGSTMLESLGFEVLTCANADDALAVLVDDSAFDVVFTDMMMPGSMGGLGLAQTVERLYPSLRVILTSGWSDAELPKDTRRDRPFLLKPYTLDHLEQAFSRVLPTHSAASVAG